MGRLIDEDLVIDTFEKELSAKYNRREMAIGFVGVKNILQGLPSAEPDIIACGDCKHWICHDRRCGYWNHGVKPLDWCCHAERRTDD